MARELLDASLDAADPEQPVTGSFRVHVEVLGSGPRIALVHGSAGNSGRRAQRPLAQRYMLVMPTTSGGGAVLDEK
jgi:hypothetical protein